MTPIPDAVAGPQVAECGKPLCGPAEIRVMDRANRILKAMLEKDWATWEKLWQEIEAENPPETGQG